MLQFVSTLDDDKKEKLVFQWNSPLGGKPGTFFSLKGLHLEQALVSQFCSRSPLLTFPACKKCQHLNGLNELKNGGVLGI